jgi:hypothetical protein
MDEVHAALHLHLEIQGPAGLETDPRIGACHAKRTGILKSRKILDEFQTVSVVAFHHPEHQSVYDCRAKQMAVKQSSLKTSQGENPWLVRL